MEKVGHSKAFERILIWIAIAFAIFCLAVEPTPSFADNGNRQNIHVDDALGSDSNSGLTETEPVTSSNGSWHRVVNLGVFGADTGVVAKNINDTPTAEWVRQAMREKPDRTNRSDTREVIPGHGELPYEDIEESEIANMRVRRRYVWETFIAPNGQLAERVIDVVETVEAY